MNLKNIGESIRIDTIFYFSPEGNESIYFKANGSIYHHPLFSVDEFKLAQLMMI